MDPLLLVGSLVAILALAGLAHWLQLGRDPRIADEEDARRAADHAVDGFTPVRFGIDADGRGALLADEAGRLLLLKPHGNFFAGRLLGPSAGARREGEALVVSSGEKRFGAVTLTLAEPASWAAAVDKLKQGSDA